MRDSTLDVPGLLGVLAAQKETAPVGAALQVLPRGRLLLQLRLFLGGFRNPDPHIPRSARDELCDAVIGGLPSRAVVAVEQAMIYAVHLLSVFRSIFLFHENPLPISTG